jgi:hypothetical protein
MAELVTPEAPILPRPRILRQDWMNVSFLHWAVDPGSIAHLYPPDTEPDTFEGSSFVGVVPFQMADTGFARGPAFFGTFLSDQRPAVFGRPNRPPRRGLPVPRHHPARHGGCGQVDLPQRCAGQGSLRPAPSG